ncbi:PATL5 [Linum perenne]
MGIPARSQYLEQIVFVFQNADIKRPSSQIVHQNQPAPPTAARLQHRNRGRGGEEEERRGVSRRRAPARVSRSLSWRIQFLEQSIQKLELKPGGVSSLLQISDLNNSPPPSKKELRTAMKQVVGILQPE